MEIRIVGTGCDDVTVQMLIQTEVLGTVPLVALAKGLVALPGEIRTSRS